ncbi:50S ribosomal protein L11 methyltransferase [Luteimonas sp. 8-5]|jgi:predicted nicotinamide N-methyase|uniref:class I SAM-dependent methyltransferase n=1 Tax=Luteimonas sp. 8-5 TaxID=3039387 RepID=UPI0024372C22|nr:methyltransferase domain-containing protein [Luteimonas sp. 8-5]MDG6348106.1 50S ribosomal protein L11 methyltransferase [Luteimonas sp. 8-5]
MPGYQVREIEQPIGGHRYRLRLLSDTQQFADPDGHGARAGVSSAQWSLFGQLWPAGRMLAQAMDRFDIAGKRILELGCGIGLASLVLQRRGADVVASDLHPLAEVFLAYNAALNDLPAVPFRHIHWDLDTPNLGMFDAIVASDVLYERGHAELIAGMVERHALPMAEVLVADPGRGNSGRFTALLAGLGFSVETERCPMDDGDPPPHRGRLLHFRRGMPA